MTTLLDSLKVTINGFAAGHGCALGVAAVRGLDDAPDVRTADSARPDQDGDYAGTDRLSSRVVEVDFNRTLDLTTATTVLDGLRRATSIGDSELLVEGMPGLPALRLAGRVRKVSIPTDGAMAVGSLKPKMQFYCPDPLRYSATETVLLLDLREQLTNHSLYASHRPYASPIRYDGITGAAPVYLTPPVTPPVTPGGRVGLVVQFTATNDGIYPTAPLFRIYGPSPAFSLLQATTNRRWSYTQPIDAADYLEVDMHARTVLLNGTASRRQFKRGVWWDLPAGVNSVAYLPAEPAVGTQVELRFRSAY